MEQLFVSPINPVLFRGPVYVLRAFCRLFLRLECPSSSWDLQDSGAAFQESPEQSNPSLTVFLESLYWLVCVVSVVNSEDGVFPFNRNL